MLFRVNRYALRSMRHAAQHVFSKPRAALIPTEGRHIHVIIKFVILNFVRTVRNPIFFERMQRVEKCSCFADSVSFPGLTGESSWYVCIQSRLIAGDRSERGNLSSEHSCSEHIVFSPYGILVNTIKSEIWVFSEPDFDI